MKFKKIIFFLFYDLKLKDDLLDYATDLDLKKKSTINEQIKFKNYNFSAKNVKIF